MKAENGIGIYFWLGKFLTANVLAFVLFSCVGYFYYYGGRSPNVRLARCIEGRTTLQLDANGFNNMYYSDFGRDLTDVDVLVLGSSHIEAHQVLKDENWVYLMNSRFASNNDGCSFYSCGCGGYFLSAIVSRYESALKRFAPRKYAILELMEVPTIEAINDGLENPRSYKIQKRSRLRIILGESGGVWGAGQYYNMNKMRKTQNSKKNGEFEKTDQHLQGELKEAWKRLAKWIAEVSREQGVKPIILCHKSANIAKDGSYVSRYNIDEMAAFRAICEQEGIVFVDATERFREEYEKNDVWAYGFCNAGIVSGHLNRDGHRMVADVLEEKIRELEAENKESEAQQ